MKTIMNCIIAFATELLKKLITVANATRNASFISFLCNNSVKNTNKNGIINKPKGGKKKEPIIMESIPTRSPHLVLPYFFKK